MVICLRRGEVDLLRKIFIFRLRRPLRVIELARLIGINRYNPYLTKVRKFMLENKISFEYQDEVNVMAVIIKINFGRLEKFIRQTKEFVEWGEFIEKSTSLYNY